MFFSGLLVQPCKVDGLRSIDGHRLKTACSECDAAKARAFKSEFCCIDVGEGPE